MNSMSKTIIFLDKKLNKKTLKHKDFLDNYAFKILNPSQEYQRIIELRELLLPRRFKSRTKIKF